MNWSLSWSPFSLTKFIVLMKPSIAFSQLYSTNLDGKCLKIEGHDFNRGVDYHQLLKSMLTTGFQASNLAEAIESVHQML
ncbi:deoxyhypusine synthase [Trifolium repens]|nr:deoxyhypusine synthase [Trifolium repens]